MDGSRLRDRDAVVTCEGLIFRVYGYSHPPKAFICDPEYAPSNLYKSADPKACRAKGKKAYYKFYSDEGLQFVQQNLSQHMVWHEPLGRKLVGIHQEHIKRTRRPAEALQSLLQKKPEDPLVQGLHSLIDLVLGRTGLSESDFGVFGSLLNNFYHPSFSDLDLIVYGNRPVSSLAETLSALYVEANSPLRNEFEDMDSVGDKHWRFVNYSLNEYVWHQRRKEIYGLFHHRKSRRRIKAEFEPVKRWDEIQDQYNPKTRIKPLGWVKMIARITDDREGAFMPSSYRVEPVKMLGGVGVESIERVVSFVEEFRMQAQKDELIYVEGKLERVDAVKPYHQVVLTHGPRYYEQVLKVCPDKLTAN